MNPSPTHNHRHRFRTVFALAVLFTLTLAACGGPPEGAGGGWDCTAADLVAPDNTSPAPGEIVLDIQPLFVWSYSSCEPENYQAEVTTYGGYAFGSTQTATTLSGLITNWTFDDALEPATQYEWRVAANLDGSMGPYSTSTFFWTGPICETAALQAPIQNTPDYDSVVDNEFPPLGWSYPNGCIPEGTLLQLDTHPGFPGPNLVAGSGGPRIGQIPLSALADCTQYYWRVRSENPGGEGPWSETWTFRTDLTGTCAPPPTCATGSLIAPFPAEPDAGDLVDDLMPGFSWFYPDVCQPEGYRIDVTTYGGYDFGTTYSGGTGDPSTSWGLADMLEPATQYEWRVAPINGEVLGPYSPSTPFWTGPQCATAALAAPLQNTPADGSTVATEFPPLGWSYPGGCLPEFTLLELDIDPSFPGPNLVAGFGGPRIGQIPAEALDNCEQYHWRVRGENGDGAGPYSPTWTFFTDFDGDCPGGGAGGAAPMGMATRNLNCRAGDSQVFTETGFFEEGQEAEIVGRNQQSTWLLVPLRLGGGNCWVSALYVDLPDNALGGLKVFASPPTPTPVPTATQPVIANPFAVTNVSVSVDQVRYSGKCPVRFTFTAQITTNGPGTVDYRWLRSDQAQAGVQSLVFSSAGTQAVESTWDISGGVHSYLWKRVEILSPNSLLSNLAEFSATCQ